MLVWTTPSSLDEAPCVGLDRRMEGDVILTQAEAEHIHHDGYARGFTVMWTVSWNTLDYPRRAAVRPFYIGAGGVHGLKAVLLADSLDAVRAQLPRDLTQMDRWADDDPRIVETWI